MHGSAHTNRTVASCSSDWPFGPSKDYEFVDGFGDLNEFNGRFCITPEYPEGIFAYFVTIDEQANPLYPYTIGPSYFGIVQSGNTGPQSGHNAIANDAISYNLSVENTEIEFYVYPNPTDLFVYIRNTNKGQLLLFNLVGELLDYKIHDGSLTELNLASYSSGMYIVQFKSDDLMSTTNIVKK